MLTRFRDLDRFLGWPEFDWPDFDRAVSLLDSFRRGTGRWLPQGTRTEGGWMRADLWDSGEELVFTADVPGLSENDIHITLNQDILTISAERPVDVPEGYSAHRRERPSTRFSRSFSLPASVDAEKATALVKDGVLTVRLAKAPEARPRRISVQTS